MFWPLFCCAVTSALACQEQFRDSHLPLWVTKGSFHVEFTAYLCIQKMLYFIVVKIGSGFPLNHKPPHYLLNFLPPLSSSDWPAAPSWNQSPSLPLSSSSTLTPCYNVLHGMKRRVLSRRVLTTISLFVWTLLICALLGSELTPVTIVWSFQSYNGKNQQT